MALRDGEESSGEGEQEGRMKRGVYWLGAGGLSGFGWDVRAFLSGGVALRELWTFAMRDRDTPCPTPVLDAWYPRTLPQKPILE